MIIAKYGLANANQFWNNICKDNFQYLPKCKSCPHIYHICAYMCALSICNFDILKKYMYKKPNAEIQWYRLKM